MRNPVFRNSKCFGRAPPGEAAHAAAAAALHRRWQPHGMSPTKSPRRQERSLAGSSHHHLHPPNGELTCHTHAPLQSASTYTYQVLKHSNAHLTYAHTSRFCSLKACRRQHSAFPLDFFILLVHQPLLLHLCLPPKHSLRAISHFHSLPLFFVVPYSSVSLSSLHSLVSLPCARPYRLLLSSILREKFQPPDL